MFQRIHFKAVMIKSLMYLPLNSHRVKKKKKASKTAK